MTPTTLAPPPAQPVPAGSTTSTSSTSGPQPYRWTIAEYRELDKTGLFHDKKTMLLDGELYVMVMPNPPHDTALGLVEEWLRTVFTSGHHVRTQKGFDIGARNDPGPDVAVVPGSLRDYATKTPTSAILVVEVADSSLQIDSTKKPELYATARVPDYWVIDLPNRRLLVYRDPAPSPAGLGAAAYKTHLTFGPGDSVSPLAAPNSSIRVADLLP
jgi:Uma2 family endonuclease